jgi:hypothetical protein
LPQIPLIFAGAFLSIASAIAAGRLIAANTPLPPSIRFATGAAAYSLIVFLLLACHAGYPAVFLLWGGFLIALAFQRAQTTRPLAHLPWSYRALFGVYGAMYLIVALAPEIQEDAAGYHLRIVSDYVRLHAFSDQISFYDALPHGLEMLFVPAFSIGAHSAAKLVHFAFLIALVPLVREIARELEIADRAGTAAAALLFMAPVCGVAGTAAYTDMALVCACCSVLYLLIRWRREGTREGSASLLMCAGLNAGFCFAIKPSFGWVVVPALLFVTIASRRAPPLFAGMAALSIVPWMLRAWFLTGNPFAPFLNAWFPNAASTASTERHLFEMYSAFRPQFSWLDALPAYTVTGGHQGLLGPAFLLLPLALSALYRKRGRRLLGCSLLLAAPFLADTGTRFLLPALVPASLALVSILPAPALVLAVAGQAIGSAPPVLDLYERRPDWRIRDIPLKAALRVLPEQDYLRRTLPGFPIGRMVVRNTSPGAQIFVCTALPESYIPRKLLFYWQSALAERFTNGLHLAAISHGTPAELLSLRWEPDRYRSLRMTALSELRIVETGAPSSAVLEAWRPWTTGQTLNIPFTRARTGADLLIWPADSARPTIEALSRLKRWQTVEASGERSRYNIDLRRDVTAYLRRCGYRYILIPVAGEGFAEIGVDMARHPAAWGVKEVERSGNYWLFYIRPDLF